MTRRPIGSKALREKADAPLWREIERAQLERVLDLPVMVVLVSNAVNLGAPNGGPSEASLGALAFETRARQLIDQLQRAGATSIRPDPISGSVALRAPLAVLEAAAARDDVRQIVLDSPRNVLARRRQ